MNDSHPDAKNEKGLSSFLKKIMKKKDENVTEEEIMDMVLEGHENGMLAETEAEMIGNIFEFGDKNVSDIMTHRKNIVGIDAENTINETFKIIMDMSYSRYPIYDGDIDNIVGILHLRDLFKIYVDEDNREKTIMDMKNQLLFDVCYVPETRNLSVLFKEMQLKKLHMVVVVDEYGQTSGIVTMEDIIEEIVGDIQDEFDEEEELIVRQPDGSYILSGQTLLTDLEDMFDVQFDCEEIDTINGYMLYKMGKIPDNNEKFTCECNGYNFSIVEVKNKMITKVCVTCNATDGMEKK